MKGMVTMQETRAQVRSYSGADAMWVVECTECGPLAICSEATVDSFAVDHMTFHGAEVAR